MKNTIEQLHLASQYLAAANISFQDKKEDDSHTNLGWDSQNKRITSHYFGEENFQIGLNLATGELQWLKKGVLEASIETQSSSHAKIKSWLVEQTEKSNLGKEYKYEFHYELPYTKIADEDTFAFDSSHAFEFAKQLSIAQSAFELFLTKNELESPIRIWPHHFDLGIYAKLKGPENLFLGAGLAVHDTMIDEMYYYSSGWNGAESIVTKTLTGLKKGEWRSDWNGATMPSNGVTMEEAVLFLNQTSEEFIKLA